MKQEKLFLMEQLIEEINKDFNEEAKIKKAKHDQVAVEQKKLQEEIAVEMKKQQEETKARRFSIFTVGGIDLKSPEMGIEVSSSNSSVSRKTPHLNIGIQESKSKSTSNNPSPNKGSRNSSASKRLKPISTIEEGGSAEKK